MRFLLDLQIQQHTIFFSVKSRPVSLSLAGVAFRYRLFAPLDSVSSARPWQVYTCEGPRRKHGAAGCACGKARKVHASHPILCVRYTSIRAVANRGMGAGSPAL